MTTTVLQLVVAEANQTLARNGHHLHELSRKGTSYGLRRTMIVTIGCQQH